MKRSKRLIAALAIAVFSVPVFSQMNLNNLYSHGVLSGKYTYTKIDSAIVDTKVGGGVARTTLTLTATPGLYTQCSYYSEIVDSVVTWDTVKNVDSALYSGVDGASSGGSIKIVDTVARRIDTAAANGPHRVVRYIYSSGYKCPDTGEVIDSIEIILSFNLPADFVAKNLYLWVNGERQTGYIQDRALANQQYNQIVGKRRDPALLEFWGNGQYNLRIFPVKSLVSRKVAIEFEHTFDDDSLNLVTAPLPIQYDSSNLSYSYITHKNLPIGFMRVLATATDSRDYRLNFPGLGTGSFSMNAPLTLEKNNIGMLFAGSMNCNDPSGQYEFLWSAPDKNGKTTLGFSTRLSKSNVTLDPEPNTRIIVLDIRNATWNCDEYNTKQSHYTYPWSNNSYNSGYATVDILTRAKKSAVLCLQSYVAQNQKFNIVLTRQEGQEPTTIFESPVSPTDDNLAIAYDAIVNAKLSSSTTLEALTKAISQAPKGIVLFISDLYQPYDYGKYEDQTYSKYTISDDGVQYDSLLARISRTQAASQTFIYTIGDDYRLTQIANSSGGANLGSLRWDSYYRKSIGHSSEGTLIEILQLPPLFSNRSYGASISGIKVTAPDYITECVFTTDAYSYYYVLTGSRGGMATNMALDKRKSLAKTNIAVAPYYYYGDSTMFRLAAKLMPVPLPSQAKIEFTITGKMSGLGFTKKIIADLSSALESGDAADQYGLWAFRKTEQLGIADWSKNADSIRWIGQDYHIVTRQTSLLALEPGMELWKDTINPSNQTTNDAKGGALSDEASYSSPTNRSIQDSLSTSLNIDGISLHDLIAKKAAVLDNKNVGKRSEGSLNFSKAGVKIDVPQLFGGQELSVSLYSLQGRLLMMKKCATVKGSAGTYMVNFKAKTAGRGIYIVKTKIGSFEKTLSVPLF